MCSELFYRYSLIQSCTNSIMEGLIMKQYLSFFMFSICSIANLNLAYAGPKAEVAIKDYSFAPATLTVKTGTKVIWTNYDEDSHSVSDIGGKHLFLHSQWLNTFEKYSYTFMTPGTYQYTSEPYPHMVGKIIVTNEAISEPQTVTSKTISEPKNGD